MSPQYIVLLKKKKIEILGLFDKCDKTSLSKKTQYVFFFSFDIEVFGRDNNIMTEIEISIYDSREKFTSFESNL